MIKFNTIEIVEKKALKPLDQTKTPEISTIIQTIRTSTHRKTEETMGRVAVNMKQTFRLNREMKMIKTKIGIERHGVGREDITLNKKKFNLKSKARKTKTEMEIWDTG